MIKYRYIDEIIDDSYNISKIIEIFNETSDTNENKKAVIESLKLLFVNICYSPKVREEYVKSNKWTIFITKEEEQQLKDEYDKFDNVNNVLNKTSNIPDVSYMPLKYIEYMTRLFDFRISQFLNNYISFIHD